MDSFCDLGESERKQKEKVKEMVLYFGKFCDGRENGVHLIILLDWMLKQIVFLRAISIVIIYLACSPDDDRE